MNTPDDIRHARRVEFEQRLSSLSEPISRRRFIELMGASLALAGVAGCTRAPQEKIVPYVRQSEQVIPGRPLFFASAVTLGGYATGVLVESHLGRPTKVEGNPNHPASLGATDAYAQATPLDLYDPARSQTIVSGGRIRTWPEFQAALTARLDGLRAQEGAGLRFLTETVTSPTLADQLRAILTAFPQARWHRFDPVARDAARAGAQLAFGQPAEARYHLDSTDVLLILDGDFLAWAPGHVRYAHDFAELRRVRAANARMSRVYVVESTPSLAGSIADERIALPPSQIPSAAAAIASALGVNTGASPRPTPPGLPQTWLSALVADLQAHAGASLVVAGDTQPPIVHALAHAMNQLLGNVGRTVEYTAPVEVDPVDHATSIQQLTQDLASGQVELLVILGGNPAYTAPADVPFADNLARVPMSVHLSLYEDETSARCTWHVPELHPLETWSDVRAYDGTATIMQPLIAPLYVGKSAHELLAAFSDQPEQSAHDIVKSYWQGRSTAADFEASWRKMLHDGVVPASALAPAPLQVQTDAIAQAAGQLAQPAAAPGTLELVFRPDHSIYDGRFAANGWLQELPKPLTKVTWDNVALVSPATASRLGLSTSDVVELRSQGRVIRAPIWVLAGQADDTITVTLGYGRSKGAGAANNAGYNAYAIRRVAAPWSDLGVELRKTGATHALAETQKFLEMANRPIVPATTLDAFRRDPKFTPEAGQPGEPSGTLYPPYPYHGNAWGMAIDQSVCLACNACVTACQAENNIPVVGKNEVLRGRAMHWLRIDTYVNESSQHPLTYHQPVPCMHCEQAPCELVCPVGATVHSSDGLNDMVYNRCVGTRYCSNNCPYKVRHFNFFQYADYSTPSLKLLRNPDVTVRERGVMEKCTYCVQRIRAAQIDAEREGRPIRDGEVLTACQAACPTGAIVFGNINDPGARVSQMKAEPHNYALLGELNTWPRTSYLGVVANPNPATQGA